MQPEIIDVLIIEDEPQLAHFHAEILTRHPLLRLAGIAANLKDARKFLRASSPRLILLDNYLPDGKGISLLNDPALKSLQCAVIFITAASDMETCSMAIRNGAFDYLLKPVSLKRLEQSLVRYIKFYEQQRIWKVVDQQGIDELLSLQAVNTTLPSSNKGIEEATWQKILSVFNDDKRKALTIDDIVTATGLSKTTLRRYLEHSVSSNILSVERSYGQPGQPRRLYRFIDNDNLQSH
ncbi:response regulator [Klebsiella aerogenes]